MSWTPNLPSVNATCIMCSFVLHIHCLQSGIRRRNKHTLVGLIRLVVADTENFLC